MVQRVGNEVFECDEEIRSFEYHDCKSTRGGGNCSSNNVPSSVLLHIGIYPNKNLKRFHEMSENNSCRKSRVRTGCASKNRTFKAPTICKTINESPHFMVIRI